MNGYSSWCINDIGTVALRDLYQPSRPVPGSGLPMQSASLVPIPSVDTEKLIQACGNRSEFMNGCPPSLRLCGAMVDETDATGSADTPFSLATPNQ